MNITVTDLLNSTYPDQYNDKVFWYASSVSYEKECIIISIDSENIVSNSSVCKELNCLTISDLMGGDATKSGYLVSSGVFLWINKKFIITQRTLDAVFDPGKWTSPAGRCDRTPYETAFKELVEEVSIFSNRDNKPYIPNKKFINYDKYQCHRYDVDENTHEIINLPFVVVKTFLNGALIEKKSMYFFMNKSNNTVELRLPVSITIDEDYDLINQEFNTEVKQINFKDLQKYDCVDTLKVIIHDEKTSAKPNNLSHRVIT